MELLSVLTDPAVVITILIALFAHYLAAVGRHLVKGVIALPSALRIRLRIKKVGYKRSLLLTATSQSQITWNIVRTYALLLLFIGTFVAYFLVIVFMVNSPGDLPISVQLLLAFPVFV